MALVNRVVKAVDYIEHVYTNPEDAFIADEVQAFWVDLIAVCGVYLAAIQAAIMVEEEVVYVRKQRAASAVDLESETKKSKINVPEMALFNP